MGADKSSGLSFPNYKEISKAHKIDYIKIKNHKELRNKLNKILKNKKSIICELIMNPDEEQIPKAINRRDSSGKSIPTEFEDMYPFLPRSELSSNYLIMKKGIIISGNLAQDHEFIFPFYRLLEEDFKVDVCLLEGKPVKGILGTDLPPNKNHEVKKIEEVSPNDYDILVLPGGVKAMEKVRQNLKNN